jgi:hypothetical protein
MMMTEYEEYHRVTPAIADWHARLNFVQVKKKKEKKKKRKTLSPTTTLY